MTTAAARAPSDLLRSVAAHDLTGSRWILPATQPEADEWRALLDDVVRTRLEGALARAVRAGALVTDSARRTEVRALHAAALASCLRLEELLLRVVDQLDAAGIEHRVLKGSAVAHLDHDDPSDRCFGDVDLLVRGDQLEGAIQVLAEMGHRRHFPEPRTGFDRRFTKSVTMSGHTALEVDVHRTLAEGPFGMWIRVGDLWTPGEAFALADREVLALGPTGRFLHAAYHAALGDPQPRLTALRDVAVMLQRGSIDGAEVLETVHRWRGAPVLRRALGAAAAVLALDVESHELLRWAERERPSRQDLRRLRPYASDARSGYAVRAIATVSALPGLADRAAYVGALLFPDRAYVRGRHRGRCRRLWAAARAWARTRVEARSRR